MSEVSEWICEWERGRDISIKKYKIKFVGRKWFGKRGKWKDFVSKRREKKIEINSGPNSETDKKIISEKKKFNFYLFS